MASRPLPPLAIMTPMTLDSSTCYRALRARDARFDGRFFVAVSSTRIYCRPVCTVKPPRLENCRFYPSAAAAEVAGFRPCLRCRPELAPGNASVDATTRLAQAAASLIEDRTLDAEGLVAVAARLGITDRHLRRAFGAEFGVSPVEFAQTQRLLLAKRLLTDTGLTVTEIAFASGFGSLRRFNALFKQRYRLQPGELRRHMNGETVPVTDVLNFELSFRPPYDWPAISTFLGARTIAGVEILDGTCYRRTVRVVSEDKDHLGWVEIGLSTKKPALRVAVSASLVRVLPTVLSRVKALMDLSCNPTERSPASGSVEPSRMRNWRGARGRHGDRPHRTPRHAGRARPHRGRSRARRGGWRPRADTSYRYRRDTGAPARAAGRGRVDCAIHRDAGACVAGCVSSYRSRRHESAG